MLLNMSTSIPYQSYQISFTPPTLVFQVPSYFHCLLRLELCKQNFGPSGHIMSTISLLKWCDWQGGLGFLLKTNLRNNHVTNGGTHRRNSVIYKYLNYQKRNQLLLPEKRWKQKHTLPHKFEVTSTVGHLIVRKGVLITLYGHFANQGPLPGLTTCSSSWSPWQPPASKRGENLHSWDFERQCMVNYGISTDIDVGKNKI